MTASSDAKPFGGVETADPKNRASPNLTNLAKRQKCLFACTEVQLETSKFAGSCRSCFNSDLKPRNCGGSARPGAASSGFRSDAETFVRFDSRHAVFFSECNG